MEDRHKKKPVIGLIGGVGSGKSLAAAEFAKYGAKVISGDEFGHEALRRPEIKERVVQRWGKEILDAKGDVNRRKLGAIVFADPEERKALEALVFPWIERRIREEVDQSMKDSHVKFVVLDAAIMLEAKWAGVCDRIVFVDTPREQRLRRLADQRGWSAEDVERREKAQWSLKDKITHANTILKNAGSPDDLAQQVRELVHEWGILDPP
jgi:dephospho-CoA kinase